MNKGAQKNGDKRKQPNKHCKQCQHKDSAERDVNNYKAYLNFKTIKPFDCRARAYWGAIPRTRPAVPEYTSYMFSIYPLPLPVKLGLTNLVWKCCDIYGQDTKTIFFILVAPVYKMCIFLLRGLLPSVAFLYESPISKCRTDVVKIQVSGWMLRFRSFNDFGLCWQCKGSLCIP